MDLIDRADVCEILADMYPTDGEKVVSYKAIDTAYTKIQSLPLVRGKWEEPQPSGVMTWDKRAYAQCSVCGQKAYLGWHDNYCRFCGAKMEG